MYFTEPKKFFITVELPKEGSEEMEMDLGDSQSILSFGTPQLERQSTTVSNKSKVGVIKNNIMANAKVKLYTY